MKKAVFVVLFLLSASPVLAGDYFMWLDWRGTVHLSNIAPPKDNPYYRTYQLEDVSWEAVRAAEKREDLLWMGIKLEELGERIDKLTAAIYETRRPEIPPINFIQTSTAVVTRSPFFKARTQRSK